MKKMTLFDKILGAVGAAGFVFWLGGSIVRLALAYDLFEPGTQMVFKNYSSELKEQLIRMYALSSPYTDISFIITFVAVLFLFLKFIKEIRNYGWLFMSMLLILIMAVPNAFLIYFDFRLSYYFFQSPNIEYAIKEFFIPRFTKFNVIDPLMILSGITIVFFTVFRPLVKTNLEIKDEN